MTLKYIRNIKLPLIATIVAIAFSVIGSLSAGQTAQAWCNNISLQGGAGGYQNACVSDNYDDLPQSVKSKVGPTSYYDFIEKCVQGNAGGTDYGIREGGCADAARSCLSNITNTDYCTGDVMASMVGGLFGDPGNRGCNEGRLTSVGSDDCNALALANKAALEAETAAAIKAATDGANCTVPNTGSLGDQTRARDACVKAMQEACTAPSLNDNGTLKDSNDLAKYRTCLENAKAQTAKDKKECDARSKDGSGIWLEDQSGTGGNYVEAGCYANYTDLKNSEACKAAGGVWELIDAKDKANASDDVWQCRDPAGTKDDPNNNKDDEVDSGPLGSPSSRLEGPKYECGQAKTNLLGCGSEQGATALQNVLRIFVIVLTFGVGIAALGGLAYSAVQYAGASDNQSNVSAARERIRNVVIGLLLYGFLLAIANWLIPGGIL